ncbi:MAG TPA: hypothetical protein VIM19_20535 [Actinomycetes bacterium]
MAGARTLLGIAEWIHDAGRDELSRLGIGADQVLPTESTDRRSLALLDAETWLCGWGADGHPGWAPGRRRVIAVDGKIGAASAPPAVPRSWWPRSSNPARLSKPRRELIMAMAATANIGLLAGSGQGAHRR